MKLLGKSPALLFGQFAGVAFIYLIFFSMGVSEAFFTVYTTKMVLAQTVIVGVGALGMTLIIISGGIDLSVGSVIALSCVTTALVLKGGGSIPTAVAVGTLTGAAVGLLNGMLIVSLKIVPFIATLGTLGIARGLAKIFSNERTVNPSLESIRGLSEVMAFERDTPIWDLPPGVWVMFGLGLLVAVILHFTVFGRFTFAIGSNEPTARLCGVPVSLCKIGLYTLSGALTGVSGVLLFGQLTIGDPTTAVGKELDIIAATVIGGGSLSGGQGSVLGSLIGAFIMSLLRNGCLMMEWPNPIQEIVIGAIIIFAVALDQFRHRRGVD
ncbi:MAG: ABC transporter permease [Candidatus Omnitrophica bacterium]|nr:ABC transporter permease [Candidatus Omnitrophota bacterium]